jgi:transposase
MSESGELADSVAAMPKPYSQDLRERVVDAVEEGQPSKHRIIKKMCPTLPILISLSVILAF